VAGDPPREQQARSRVPVAEGLELLAAERRSRLKSATSPKKPPASRNVTV
jgi:hypothetical protein